MIRDEITFIDLFAGCGGFSVGLEMAGLKGVANLEVDQWACDSLRHNFPDSEVIQDNIKRINRDRIATFRGVDVIVGGPPCQGFSVAGSSQFGVDDPRNELAKYFLFWVSVLRPKAAIIENVPQILTKKIKNKTVGEYIAEEFGKLGYQTKSKILISSDYGVPQVRKRAYIVAFLEGFSFSFPLKTHCSLDNNALPLLQESGMKNFVTVHEALSDLPKINSSEGSDDQQEYAEEPSNEYQRLIRNRSQHVYNHIAMNHTPRLIERFKTISPGMSLKDVAKEHGQIEKLTGKISEKPFKYNNYRLDPGKPSMSIPASFQSLFLHPYLHRNLTAREAARLMSFPDHFIFKGKRTTMSWEKFLSQYNQIGNAVCPLVAKSLGESIRTTLKTGSTKSTSKTIYEVKVDILKNVPTKVLIAKNRIVIHDQLTKLLCKSLEESFHDDRIITNNGILKSISNKKKYIFLTALALLFSTEGNCPICDPNISPKGIHAGEMPFLITKECFSSLVDNDKDHGLDYHLKSFDLDASHEDTQIVADIIEQLGFGKISTIKNIRTGRDVRGLVDVICPESLERLRPEVMEYIASLFR